MGKKGRKIVRGIYYVERYGENRTKKGGLSGKEGKFPTGIPTPGLSSLPLLLTHTMMCKEMIIMIENEKLYSQRCFIFPTCLLSPILLLLD